MNSNDVKEDNVFLNTSPDEKQEMQKQNRSPPVLHDIHKKNWEQDIEIELDDAELEKIEKKLKDSELDIEQSLEEIEVNTKGIYISILVSALFIAFSLAISNMDIIYGLTTLAQGKYENNSWDALGQKYMFDVTSLEELNMYIEKVYFPQTFLSSDTQFSGYFIGSRMTLKMYNTVPNPDHSYSEAITESVNIDISSDNLNGKQEKKHSIGEWEYVSGGGYAGHGGYVEYFFNTDLQEALSIWRQMKPIWLCQDFGILRIETLIHNVNQHATLLYTQTFNRHPSGFMYIESSTSGMFIEIYEDSKNVTFISIIVLLGLYAVGLTAQIYQLLLNLFRVAKIFFATLKLDLQWFEYLEFINVTMALTTILIFSNSVFSNIGIYKLPILSENKLDGLINYFSEFLTLTRINAISCLLIMIKITIVLRNKFPSFGVLFDTIRRAQTVIINFSIITILLLLGFVLMGMVAFGPKHAMFKTIQGAFNNLFTTILANLHYENLKAANDVISPVYSVFYIVLFFNILLNMFIAMVMSIYVTIRKRSQLLLQAKAEIVKEEGKKLFDTLLDLIFFRHKNTLHSDAEEYLRLLSHKKDGQIANEGIDNLKMLEISIVQQYHKDYYAIFKYNLGQLKTRLQTGTMKTHEQFKEEIKENIKKFFVNKRKNVIKNGRLRANKYYNYVMVKQMGIFLVFTICLLLAVLMRLNTEKINDLDVILKQLVQYDNFTNIVSETEIYHYVSQTLLPTFFNDGNYNFNYIIKEPMARLTFNKYVLVANENRFSKDISSEYIANQHDLFTENFQGNFTKIKYSYVPPGNAETYKGKGGYVINLYSDMDVSQLMAQIQDDRLFDRNMQSMVIEWVLYNSNYDMYTYCSLIFVNDISGSIDISIQSSSINISMFQSPFLVIGIFEIFVGCFVVYFIVKEAITWYRYWKIEHEKIKKKILGEKKTKLVMKKLIPEKVKAKGCSQTLRIACSFLMKVLEVLINFVIKIVLATYYYFSSGFFHVINVIGDGLCLALLSQIVLFRSNPLVYSYNESEKPWTNVIGDFSALSEVNDTYRTIAALLLFISFIRLLQFYKFSSDLAILTDVLNSAKVDVLFFLAMFFIIHFGYSLMGHLLLGHALFQYHTIVNSLLYCYLMLLGLFNLNDLHSADQLLGLFFFGTYIVLCYLLLLNMFTAIIGAHREQVELDENLMAEPGFFQKIYSVLKSVLCEKRFNQENDLNNLKMHSEKYNFRFEKINDNRNYDATVPVIKNYENANAWYSLIEETLRLKSANTVNFPKMNLIRKSEEIQKQSVFHNIAYIDIGSWKLEPVDEKKKIWRGLSQLQLENFQLELEKAALIQSELPSKIQMGRLQKALWNETTIVEKISMWVGDRHFNEFERLCIWNVQPFLPGSFGISKDNWTIEEEKQFWTGLTVEEKLKNAKILLKNLETYKKSLKKAKNKLENLEKEAFQKLGVREFLWLGLGLNDTWKLKLYLNYPDEVEAELLGYLIIGERETSIFSLESADFSLSDYLDASNHSKITEMCYFFAEKRRYRIISDQMEDADADIRNLISYKQHLINDLENFKNQKKMLRTKLEKLIKLLGK